MMNLDVQLRLLDETTRPAREATRALERFGATANKIGARLTGTTRAVRGLATALRDVKAADGAADRATAATGRLKGTMAPIGPAARTAGTGLDRFSRAADRLALASTKAAASTKSLRNAMGATLPSGGFASAAEAQLRSVVALQKQALAGMRSLNAGGGGGRRGMGGGGGGSGSGGGSSGSHAPGIALAYEAPGLTSFARKALTDTMDAENALTQVRLTGMKPGDVERIKALAQRVAGENPLTTYAENLRGILEARTALSGDLNEAMAVFPKATRYAAIYAHSGGVSADQVKTAKDAIYQALRAGELRNVANDPARLDSLLSGIMGANIASDGRITPKMFASNIQYARSAGLSLSDQFTNLTLPFLMGELQNGGKGAHGGQAGNALMSAYSTIVQGRISKASLPEWVAAGQLDMKDVDKEHVRPGSIKGTSKFMEDPRAFVADLMANFTARGIVSQTAILEHLSAMFGNRTAAGLMDLMALQDSRMSGFADMTRMAGAGDPAAAGQKFAMISNELSTQAAGLSHAFGLLRTTAVAPFIPAVTDATRRLTEMTSATQGFLAKMLGAANDPNDPNKHGLAWGEIATLAGGAAWLGAKLVTKAPGVATLVGQAAVASQAGPVAGFLSRSTIAATVEALSARLSIGVGAGLTRVLGKGVLGGLIYEAGTFAIDKLMDALPKPTLSPEKQARADADRRQSDDAWPWQQLGLLKDSATHRRPSDFMPGGSRYGQPIPDDLKAYVQGSGTPIAGARALGGPVGSGKSYLVGEHGPEIFTPGLSGAISTHAATKLALARGSTDAGDGSTGREIRYMSFALVSAVDGVTRAVDRLGLRNAYGDGAGASGGGSGGGGGSGAGLGGRRAFGARMGGSGDGVTLPDGSTGPRVGLGRMTASAGRGARGFAKFDAKAPAIMGALMTKYGLTKEQAAGVVGNLGHESGAFTAYHEGGQAPGKGGVGWAQWTGPRRRAFERWTKNHGLDPTSDDASWRFLTEGDPETARAIAAVKKTRTAHDAMVAFEGSFERAGVKAYGSRDRFAARAMGMNPVAGVPDAVAAKPGVPDSLADRARRQGERNRAADADRAARGRPASSGASMHVGTVHVHVAAQPHHDERKIAAAVHERFNDAVRVQLNDGAFA